LIWTTEKSIIAKRSRNLGRRFAAFGNAANRLDLKLTRVLPPMLCRG
jgi:hypothetical protein